MKRIAFFITASCCALTPAAITYAQSPAPTDGGSVLEELVVTAQRRDERLQDVPISVTALSEQRLENSGVTSSEDLTLVTPGLVFARSNNFTQPTIRGVGPRNASQGDEANVAIYIDGVYRPEQFSNLFELEGVESIEVLKGPQGTLFGRNAAGGAINIRTKMPSRTFEGSVSASVGDFGYRKGTAYLSGPITDKLSANISAAALDDDGFVRNIFLNRDSASRSLTAVRGKLLFEVDARTRIWLGASHAAASDNTNQSGQALNGNTRGRQLNPSTLIATAPYTMATENPVSSKTKDDSVDLHFEREFSGFDLRLTAAWAKSSQHNVTDSDYTPTVFALDDYILQSQSESVEAIATSNGEGRLQWTVGLNYFHNDAALDPYKTGPVTLVGTQEATAAAVFGEVVWEAVDRLFLTAGLRYTSEERGATYRLITPATQAASGKDSWTDLSPRFVARYQFAENGNVYASYSRGFKSGTFNSSSVQGTTTPADPEHIDAFEVGVKSDLGERIRVNAAAFYYTYEDLQVTVPLTVNNATVFALSNAGETTIKGLEVNGEFVVTDDLRLRTGLSLLDAKFDSFPNAVVLVPNPAFITQGRPAGNTQVVRDVSGNRLSRSPEWTWSLGAEYQHDLLGGELMLSADVYSSAEWFSEPLNRLRQPAFTQVNASARWTAPGNHIALVLSAENLTDEEIYSNIAPLPNGDSVAYQRPRFVSLKAEYRF